MGIISKISHALFGDPQGKSLTKKVIRHVLVITISFFFGYGVGGVIYFFYYLFVR